MFGPINHGKSLLTALVVRRQSRVLLQASALAFALAVAYAITGRLSLGLAFANSSVTPIWPPTGIAVAALLLGGLRLWPGVALGALAANLLNGSGIETSALITVGNTLAPVLAVVIIRLVLRRPMVTMERPADVLAVIGIGGLACMTVSATLGTAALVVTGVLPGRLYSAVWPTWWIGDAAGVVLGTPLLLVAATAARARPSIPRMRAVEGIAAVALLIAVTVAVFSTHAPMAYVIFPVVLWASLRLRQAGAALAVLVVSAVSIFQTVHGNGPFGFHDVNSALVGLQAFNGSVALTAFLLAVLSRQADTAIDFLEVAVGFLEERVTARTAELVDRNQRLSILTRAGRELRELLDPTMVLDRLVLYAVELAPASTGTIGRSTLIYIEDDGMLGRVHVDHDGTGRTLRGVTFVVQDQPWIEEVVRTRLPVRAEVDLERCGPSVRPHMEAAPFTHAGYAPIIIDGAVFAVLTLASLGHEIDESDIDGLQALCEIGALAVSNARQYQGALEQALQDALTGLPNRRAFDQRIGSLPRGPYAIMALDIDDLKKVNDQHGHAVGDGLIRTVAATMSAQFRPGDLLARVGGDEFLAMLPGAAPEDCARVAERILASLGTVSLLSGRPQISIGCAGTASDDTAVYVVAAADAALYRAKRRGRGCVEVDSTLVLGHPSHPELGELMFLAG